VIVSSSAEEEEEEEEEEDGGDGAMKGSMGVVSPFLQLCNKRKKTLCSRPSGGWVARGCTPDNPGC